MNGSEQKVGAVATGIGTSGAKRRRGPRIAPVTRAVRTALAVSAAAFAFAGSGVAFAGDCTVPVDNVVHCNGDFVDTINFAVEDLTLVVGDESPSTVMPAPGDAGILADWAGDIGVTSLADIATYAANGIHAYGSGDIAIDNDGSVTSVGPGDIIGVYAYSDGGDVTIANSGSVYAYSYDALADGIFASGSNVDVANAETGSITAYGATWAAGIEAQGEDLTTVVNDGSIDAVAFAGGYSFGIYATAGDGGSASATNNGDIYANGFYSNGIYVQSGGDAHATNNGTITAGSYNYAIMGTGIHVASSAMDGVATAENTGDIIAQGYYGAAGIEALASNAGGSASITNSGNVYVGQYSKYLYGATGLVSSADGDASIDNSGLVDVYSGGLAEGAVALSFNGDASITNSGDISVESTAFLYYSAGGIIAASQNGGAFVDNSGSVDVMTKYIGTGIEASGMDGVAVTNSGDISVDAWRAYGISANAGAGDVDVVNSGTISTIYSQGAGSGWGVLATTGVGDVHVENSGSIYSSVYGQSVGIFARPGEGSATVGNSGDIYAYSYADTAAGIFARADYGDVDVDNSGSIGAVAFYGYAYGVLGSAMDMNVANSGTIEATGFYAAAGIAVSGDDLTTVDNSGSITAVAYGDARGVNATSDAGDVHVDNSGTIQAGSVLLDGIGIYAYSTEGDVSVHNDGVLVAISPNGLADGVFAYGANAEVINGASGYIGAFGYTWAAGIEAQGSDSVAVGNDGEIYVRTYGVSEAFGIYAGGGEGGASVDNNGSISVRGYDSAVAIYAQASGSIDIHNAGDVLGGYYAYNGGVYSSSYAAGIQALSGTDGAAITIDNSGTSTAISFSGSSAIEGRSLGVDGSVAISNSGDANAYALSQFGGVATGIAASAAGDAMIDNSGGIFAYSLGNAEGAVALSFNGDASVDNSGDITVVNTAFVGYTAFGAVAASTNGSASVENSGTIAVTTPYLGGGIDVVGMEGASIANSGDVVLDAWVAYAVRASSGLGDVAIDNSGTIEAGYSGPYLGYSWGINAETVGGDIAIDNSGDILSDGGRQSLAVFASTTSGDIAVDNSGSVESYSVTGLSAAVFATTTGDGNVSVDSSGSLAAASYVGTTAGAFARATLGTASITNSGDIESVSTYGTAYGVLTRGLYSGATNSGNVAAQGYAAAFGMYVDGDYSAAVDNSGDVAANALGNAFGAYAYSFVGDASITNSGDISAEGTYGVGVGALANGYYSATVSNSGSISGAAGPYGTAIGVYARAYGDVLVENSGTISASHDTAAVAVQMESLFGTATLDNSGTIETDAPVSVAVVGSNGANEIYNTGDITGAIVTFAADDLFANGNGGIWVVDNYVTGFGDGDDSIDNGAGGRIHLANGGIYLGASGADGNSFHNAGTISASDYGVIDMGADAQALYNDGVINLASSDRSNDWLMLRGDLGGHGTINVDLGRDTIYIDGNVVDGTSQTVNVTINGMEDAFNGYPNPFAYVTGTWGGDDFVGGRVLNLNPSNFLDLSVRVAGGPITPASTTYVINAFVEVEGLNDAGVTAGSVANAAHSLINSSIGTRSQRLGVAPVLGDDDVGLGPWIRAFSDQGDVGPSASGFGGDRDFGFSQENTGTEFGMNLTLGNGINFGVMGGNAEGTQKLSYASGSDRIDLHTSGLYVGWTGDRFYADASWRWMDFDATLMSVGGEQRTSGNATAFNFEGGYTGWSMAGVNFVPQLQYTRSVVDNIDTVEGSEIGMDIYGGVSERARVGLALDRTFDGGNGFTWTPYGALSAVREMDGNTGYTIADRFNGRTSTSGNSFLAELGLGVQKGRLSATGGIHLADGDALQGFYGGQLLVRYTW